MAKKSKTTLRALVQQAEAQGHEIRYVHRKDGGISITRIDGQQYQGRTGNAALRNLTGTQLSQKQIEQRLEAGRKAEELSASYKPLPKAERDIIKNIRKVQKTKNEIEKKNRKQGKKTRGMERPLNPARWQTIRQKYKGRETGVLENKLVQAMGLVYGLSQQTMSQDFFLAGIFDFAEMLRDTEFCSVTQETFDLYKDLVYPITSQSPIDTDELAEALNIVIDKGEVIILKQSLTPISFADAMKLYQEKIQL